MDDILSREKSRQGFSLPARVPCILVNLQDIHLLARQEAPVPAGEILLRDTGEVDAVKPQDIVPEMLEDTAHDAVLPGMYLDSHLFVIILRDLDVIRFNRPVLEFDSRADSLEIFRADRPVEEDVIDLLLDVGRV